MLAPVPGLTASQRRLLGWGLVAVGLVLVGALAITVFRRVTGALSSIGQPAPPRVTQQFVVDRLEEVAKLVATEMTLRDVVTFEQTRLGFSKRALLVVTGRVAAGIDLTQGTEVRIDSVTKRIEVTLPPAQILSVDVLDVTTYDERAGLFNPFRPGDRDEIQRRIRSQLMVAARASGILSHADQSAAKVLQNLLSRDGYTVEIRRPVVERKPTG